MTERRLEDFLQETKVSIEHLNIEESIMVKSIEEKVEDIVKESLRSGKLKFFTKTESVNSEIDAALEKAPSKSGGSGKNYPDIRLLLDNIPVMIEVKGKRGAFEKLNVNGEIDNAAKDGTPNYSNIQKYAVNGAVHYANAIIDHTNTYKEAIAVGINGYEENGKIQLEIGAYYISLDNLKRPKKISEYSDLSFLYKKNRHELLDKLSQINLTEDEKEKAARTLENNFEDRLKRLNQKMHDDLGIAVGQRVGLLVGMIMAGLGVDELETKVDPLDINELKGQTGKNSTDGDIIINKINSFLSNRNLPEEKKEMILRDLTNIFISSNLWKPKNRESKLKAIYIDVKNDILPIITQKDRHLDFTGKLFNVLNEWVDIPDGERNDVVLTPRYVTEFMAKLARVDKDSFVWDYAVGSAGFLISSMKLMIQDAEESIKSPEQRREKINKIKCRQLLGIEKRADIYLLAVLNMILMGDGSSNILHKDSLKDYSGKYEQGELKDEEFPANVFLLNPPYSQDGKGFNFVEKAFGRMKIGRSAILIQENAGSGNGLPYTKRLLKKNSLVASIHMADIFCGKAGVQTAVYVFDVGIPHDKNKLVKFIDFSDDGYMRQNRKKSSASVNLRDKGNAKERYQEVIDIVLGNKKSTNYFDDCVIEDTISLNGDDWTYSQHKKIDTVPTEADFKKTVKDYLSWKVSTIIREETPNFQ